MTSLIKKFFNKINANKRLLIILGIFGIFFVFFIDKIRISPDEYFYVSLGRSMAAAYEGIGCFYCIDTAHTPLFPLLISLGYYFFSIDSVITYRFIAIIFAIATLYIAFKIFEITYANKKEAFLSFLIILLFPGFFTFAGKVNIGILALFFSLVVLYLLLKKDSFWKIGLALVFVFLSKDYFVLFCGPTILLMIVIDAIKTGGIGSGAKVRKIFINSSRAFLPLLCTVIFFVAFAILPYPRMLDNMFLEAFGSWYVDLGQKIRLLFGFSQINAYIPSAAENIKDLAKAATQPSFVDSSVFASFFQKISVIYKSSYKEIDINLLAAPLIIIGFVLRVKILYLSFRHRYDLVRKDLILVLFTLVFFYFNYHIAYGYHGFRIIFPLIIPYTYFIYWALKSLLDEKNYWVKFSFAILSFLSIFIYFESNRGNNVQGNLIAINYAVALFFKYKIFINVIIYTSSVLFILIYSKLRIKLKFFLFIGILLFMFTYKTMPFAIEKHFLNRNYGKDFNLILARPYLEEIEKNKPIILTNIKSYEYYYYANSTTIPNVARRDLPIIRRSPEIVNPNRLIVLNSLSNNLGIKFLCRSRADYVFYLAKDRKETALIGFIHDYQYLNPIAEYNAPRTGQFNWGLYKINKSSCDK